MPTRSESSESRSGRAGTGAAPKKSGWALFMEKEKDYEEKKKLREEMADSIRDFWLKSGETAVVQFLHDEPYFFDGHTIKDGKDSWAYQPCQLSVQRHCLMCNEGIKQTWRGAFKVLDYRGNWDKDGKAFKWDEPLEKLWVVNTTILGALQAQKTKKKKNLNQMVLEVTKTGSGTSTGYNFETAVDDKGVRMEPLAWEEEYGDVSELVEPLTDEALLALGFSKPEDEDGKKTRRK